MSGAQERRAALRDELLQAAERMIAARGLAGLKSRDLASEIGCANGAIYNLVEDMDDLIWRVASRTLARLEAAVLAIPDSDGAVLPPARLLVRIALVYCNFAAANFELWRALFEHRTPDGKPVPEWTKTERLQLFRHIQEPLALLFPAYGGEALAVRARSLFSAVHGMVTLGLEERLVAVPLEALRSEVASVVGATLAGMKAGE